MRGGFRTKPILKAKDTNLSSQETIEVKEKDFFQGISEKVRHKREDHIKKTLEWANQGFKPASILDGGSYGSQPAAPDT